MKLMELHQFPTKKKVVEGGREKHKKLRSAKDFRGKKRMKLTKKQASYKHDRKKRKQNQTPENTIIKTIYLLLAKINVAV
jgi:hypothetical protein